MAPDETKAAPFPAPRDPEATAQRVREMFREKGFSLYRIARLSRGRYPNAPVSQIRRNFYFQLRSGLSPTLQQVLALAELTGLRLWDWLEVFGFSLDDIPRIQTVLKRPRTGLIDKDLVDVRGLIPILRYRRPGAALPVAAPLSQLLEQSGVQPAGALLARARGDFLYAKIGTEDRLAFPELLPGSIVRVDPRLVDSSLPAAPVQHSHHLFLIEHGRGLNCGRIRASGPNRVAFVAPHRSIASVEFRLGSEARILGVVDLELRFPPPSRQRETPSPAPRISSDFAEAWHPTRIDMRADQRPAALLETARRRAGLSFRSASKLSRVIAQLLGDRRYFASPGTLSDYEAGDPMPRHIHKLFTLAILYSVPFLMLLHSFGIAVNDFRGIPFIQETNVSRAQGTPLARIHESRKDFFENVRKQFGDLPAFLGSALPALSGLSQISLRDVFWLGGQANPLHPSLRGALFVLVNRRSKKPRNFSRMPLWNQPLYLLEDRNGSYLAASSTIEDGRLVVYAYPEDFTEGQSVGRHIDADVVGQIVGIARTLVSPP